MASQTSTGSSRTSGVDEGMARRRAVSRSILDDLTDAELVMSLVDGDREALAEVYRRHGSRVIAVANAALRDRTAAEDVCHDVFVEFSRHPEKFDGERGALRTYLVTIAHGRALDRLRSEQARARREAQQARFSVPTSAGADDEAIASSISAQIWAAVSALPAQEADALRLAYFGGTTYREVARILEVAEGTVKSRIRTGLRRLRVVFTEQGLITATP